MKKVMNEAYLQHKVKRVEMRAPNEDDLKAYYLLKNAYGVCALAEERLDETISKINGGLK